MKRLISIGYCIFFCLPLFAQLQPDKIYMPNIHTAQLFLTGNQYGYPIIQPGAVGALEMHFDDLEGRVKNYSYTYQLCNADWKPVDLSPFDYLDGFTQNRISQYRASSIAAVKYIHYQALLPERNCMPKLTGNYLLKVFLNGDTSKLAFTRRFLIVTNLVPISASIQQPFNPDLFKTHQKLQFSINKTKLNVLNPLQQLKVVVLQNFRWDNAVMSAQPTFMKQDIYEYNGEKDFVFPAGKEYRWIDLRSFRFLSDRIKSANREVTPVEIQVAPDGPRINQQYIWYEDLNGFYQIAGTDVSNPFQQGDYARVNFLYVPPNNQPYAGKDLYIMGQMTGYDYNDSTKLRFDQTLGVYEASLLMKQGYYTYTFGTKEANDRNAPISVANTDGNYWETENNYTILVYYRSFSDRSDQLVGTYTINSRASRQGL